MKKNKLFVILVGIAAIGVLAVLALLNKKTVEPAAQAAPEKDQYLSRPHSPVQGSADAKVTIVEFLDPECEACRAMHPIVKQLLSEYDGKVKLVIRYMPLHGNSKFASMILEEAREQGKFDQTLEALFQRQPEWGDHHSPRADLIPKIAQESGVTGTLDYATLAPKHGAKIDMDQTDGIQLGVRMTPTFFVNGVQLSEIGYEPIKQAIEIGLQ